MRSFLEKNKSDDFDGYNFDPMQYRDVVEEPSDEDSSDEDDLHLDLDSDHSEVAEEEQETIESESIDDPDEPPENVENLNNSTSEEATWEDFVDSPPIGNLEELAENVLLDNLLAVENESIDDPEEPPENVENVSNPTSEEATWEDFVDSPPIGDLEEPPENVENVDDSTSEEAGLEDFVDEPPAKMPRQG